MKEPGGTRVNCFQLDKFRIHQDRGRNRFSNGVVDEWNKLGSHVVGADTIATFKKRLSKFMDSEVR